MVLPGNVARETRKNFADILTRYIAGAPSLIGEIQANALSDAPIAQLARGGVDNRLLEQPSMDLICVELKKGNDSIITAVTTSCALIKDEVVKVADTVANKVETVVNNSKEVATLTAMAKTAERKAKHSERISFQTRGEVGAAAAKKYKRIRKELASEKTKVEMLMRQNAGFQKRLQKLEEMVEDIFFGQVETNANQDEIKTGQAKIFALLAFAQCE